MKVELKLEPEREDIQVVIHAPARTGEVEQLLRRLEGESPLLGFRGEEATPLDAAAVLRFYGEGKGVYAETAQGVFRMRERLYELEERLDSHTFVRVSQSEIVNLKQVTALDLSLTGTIKMTLTGGTVCWVSRRSVKKIKQALGL